MQNTKEPGTLSGYHRGYHYVITASGKRTRTYDAVYLGKANVISAETLDKAIASVKSSIDMHLVNVQEDKLREELFHMVQSGGLRDILLELATIAGDESHTAITREDTDLESRWDSIAKDLESIADSRHVRYISN